MDLEQLRKQAKDLVRAARGGDRAALDRLADLPVRLASAQLVLAREHGHASWPALVHAQEASVDRVVRFATSGRCHRAAALLAARPALERDRWVRLGGIAGRAPMSQIRSRKASEARPRSPTTQPGTSGRQSSKPGAMGSSCAWPGARAKATARPRPPAITQALVP